MEELRNRGYYFSCLASLVSKSCNTAVQQHLCLLFLPGKYNLRHKMLPTKQLLRKLAYKYHLLNVTRHLERLSAICALFMSEMGLQLVVGDLLESSKRKPWLATKWEWSVQCECSLQSPMTWLCLAICLWVINMPTHNHQKKFWVWRDVWPGCVKDKGTNSQGISAGGIGKRMLD